MIRYCALLVLAAVALRAAELAPPELSGLKTSATEEEGIVTGDARFSDGDLVLTADEIRYNLKTATASAKGNVVLTRKNERLLADSLTYRRSDGGISASHVRLGRDPIYVEGDSADGTRDDLTVYKVTVTYREPGAFQPTLKADSIHYQRGSYLRLGNARAGIGPATFLPTLRFEHKLTEPFVSLFSFDGGYRSSLGGYLQAGLHLPVAPDVRVGADTAIYTKRGLMFGPTASYDSENRDLHGWFRTGYIRDHGDRQADILGQPIPASRAFAMWEHNQTLSNGVTLLSSINWWKDSSILRDFRPREFFPVQEPDNILEATYTGKNYFLSAFARLQPNSFDTVQERLPEVRFDLMPTAVGGGVYERFDASAAFLRQRTPGGPHLESRRLDAFYGLTRPVAAGDYFTFTPVAGARVTHYSATEGAPTAGDYTRTLGEVGADVALRTSGTFDYKNPQWKIDGLRHLLTPKISYRYIPEAERGRRYIPQIDDRTFSTYLPTLDLGDTRNIDDLHATNVLRFGLDNAIQTRDAVYGSRDLLVFNVANDFRFKRQLGERDVSEVHTELAVMPARWLELNVYESFVPQDLTLREFNSGVTLRDGDAWSIRFSNQFLRRQVEDYAIEGRTRLNEAWEALTRLRYDARQRRFNEQSYGLVQNLSNTWRIDYVVTLYSGPRRESAFGFNVQIDTIRF